MICGAGSAKLAGVVRHAANRIGIRPGNQVVSVHVGLRGMLERAVANFDSRCFGARRQICLGDTVECGCSVTPVVDDIVDDVGPVVLLDIRISAVVVRPQVVVHGDVPFHKVGTTDLRGQRVRTQRFADRASTAQ